MAPITIKFDRGMEKYLFLYEFFMNNFMCTLRKLWDSFEHLINFDKNITENISL
jgi:hypothetical protein